MVIQNLRKAQAELYYTTNDTLSMRQSCSSHNSSLSFLLLATVLVAGGLLVVGCDSGGSSSSSDEQESSGSLDNSSTVTVDLQSSSSGSSSNASGEKAGAKASGTLTIGFHYENDSGSDCDLSTTKTVQDSDLPYNESFDPANVSGSLSSGCGNRADFDGVQVEFAPGSGFSTSGLVLSLLGENGTEITSDDDLSDGRLAVSETVSGNVDLPDNIGGDDGDDGGGDGGGTENDFSNTAAENPNSSLAIGDTEEGALESSDAVLSDIADADPNDSVTENDNAPIDVYNFSLSSQQDVSINLQARNSSGIDSRVLLYEQGTDGQATLRSEDDGGMNSDASIDEDALPAGDYYIVATSAGGATGAYQLSVSDDSKLLFWTLEDDGVVNLGDIKTGSFVKTGNNADIQRSTIAGLSDNSDAPASDESQVIDLYEQDLVNNGERGEEIAITLRRAQPSESFRPQLFVYDGNGNFLREAGNRSGTGNNSARVTGAFSVDSLYIVPSVGGGRQGAGEYELDLVSTDDFESVDTESISLGDTKTGKLELSDQRLRTYDPILEDKRVSAAEARVDAYEFTLQSEQEVRIAMSEANVDRDLRLHNASTGTIARLGANEDAITETLSPGTYYILGIAEENPDESSGQGLGEYTLELTRTGFDRIQTTSISVGDTKQGSLTEDDLRLSALKSAGGVADGGDREFIDAYELTVSAEQTVNLTMPDDDTGNVSEINSPALILYKEDSSGNVTQMASDGADPEQFAPAEITGQTLSPGNTYFIVTTSWQGFGSDPQTGDYEVTVSSAGN